MCSFDWSALGTWAAVVVALGIATAGGIRQRLRERVQGALLATSLHVEVQQCVVHARALVRKLDDSETGGILGAHLFQLAAAREDLVRYCTAFPTAYLDAATPRVHVLPLACSRPLMDMRASIAAVRIFGETVVNLSDSCTPDDVEAAVKSVRSIAAKLLAAAELAAAQVEKVATRTPRWWQCILG